VAEEPSELRRRAVAWTAALNGAEQRLARINMARWWAEHHPYVLNPSVSVNSAAKQILESTVTDFSDRTVRRCITDARKEAESPEAFWTEHLVRQNLTLRDLRARLGQWVPDTANDEELVLINKKLQEILDIIDGDDTEIKATRAAEKTKSG
jgi:hypothetical protein